MNKLGVNNIMKKKIYVSALICSTLLFMSACGGGTKYCKVDGCPRESLSHRSYCAEHKCNNFSCDNEATVSFGYCTKCLERANN